MNARLVLLLFLCAGNPTVNGNAGGEPCVFPFLYRGTVYQKCTSIDYNKPWCATTDNFDRDMRWRECTGLGNPTVNGNAGGERCVFPFLYRGTVYQKCTSIDYNKPWCATTDNYDKDMRWGECTGLVNPTINGNADGEECLFPFIYKGIKYWGCTSADHHRPWCPTTDDFNRDHRWGECLHLPTAPPELPTPPVKRLPVECSN